MNWVRTVEQGGCCIYLPGPELLVLLLDIALQTRFYLAEVYDHFSAEIPKVLLNYYYFIRN